MDAADSYRRQLSEQCPYISDDTPISEATANREWGTKRWHGVRADNRQEHLAVLYANRPLILFGD